MNTEYINATACNIFAARNISTNLEIIPKDFQ